jgi:hypothetical protein
MAGIAAKCEPVPIVAIADIPRLPAENKNLSSPFLGITIA